MLMHVVTCSSYVDFNKTVALRTAGQRKKIDFCKFSHNFSSNLSISLAQNISVPDKSRKPVSCVRVDCENITQMLVRMSATGRSYTQYFLKVQYIIIQAILGRTLVKKITVTGEKIFRVYMAFHLKNNSHADLRTSHAQFSEKGCQYREEDSKNKILS